MFGFKMPSFFGSDDEEEETPAPTEVNRGFHHA